MASHCSSRTPACRRCGTDAEGPAGTAGPRGIIIPVVAFLFFVMSGICFGMIMMAQAHMNMTRFRKFSLLLDYASENGAKSGFHRLLSLVSERTAPAAIDIALVDGLRDGTESGFAGLLDVLNPGLVQLGTEGESGDFRWRSTTGFSRQGLTDNGTCLKVIVRFDVRAAGKFSSFPAERGSSIEGELEMLAGRIPLSSIPLSLSRDMSASELDACLDENNVKISGPGGSLAGISGTAAAGTDNGAALTDRYEAVARGLGLKLFKPQDVGTAALRAILGLEASNDPVPDGVYPVDTDLGFTSVFIQGDLTELILAIDGDEQVILFRMEAGDWCLRSKPGLGLSEFSGADGIRQFDTSFGGYIIVNGSIDSLCGGHVAEDGSITPAGDEDLPSILNGTGLTIVSSEEVNITSSLIVQGAEWRNGFPYLENSLAQLAIASTGTDLLSGEERDAVISVSEGAPKKLSIQAALVSGNGTFEIRGEGKEVEIAGGLHVSGLSANGNSLAIAPDQRLLAADTGAGAILTAENYLVVSSFRPTIWKEGLE